MSKGKSREGSVADTVASHVNGVQSDSSDAGTARNSVIGSPRRASAVSIEQELQTVDDNEHALTTDSESQGESHDSDSSSEGTSSDSHHHASSPAANGLDDPDESFVVVAPPTPGARVPAASQAEPLSPRLSESHQPLWTFGSTTRLRAFLPLQAARVPRQAGAPSSRPAHHHCLEPQDPYGDSRETHSAGHASQSVVRRGPHVS
jgi:hypothetical protein